MQLLDIKKRIEKESQKRIGLKNQQITLKLRELTERERQYRLSSSRLLNAAREAKEIPSGISGLEIKERRRWADRAIYLRSFSEAKLESTKVDLDKLKNKQNENLTQLKMVNSRIELIESILKKEQIRNSVRRDLEDMDEYFDIVNSRRGAV